MQAPTIEQVSEIEFFFKDGRVETVEPSINNEWHYKGKDPLKIANELGLKGWTLAYRSENKLTFRNPKIAQVN